MTIRITLQCVAFWYIKCGQEVHRNWSENLRKGGWQSDSMYWNLVVITLKCTVMNLISKQSGDIFGQRWSHFWHALTVSVRRTPSNQLREIPVLSTIIVVISLGVSDNSLVLSPCRTHLAHCTISGDQKEIWMQQKESSWQKRRRKRMKKKDSH